MHDAPPPARAEPVVDGDGPAGPLTPERIESVLADFRLWLEGVSEGRGDNAPGAPEPVDLHTLVAQFTALRHEVNLQTRASRAAVEQTAEAIKLLGQPKADPQEVVRPLVKTLIDIADALLLSLNNLKTVQLDCDLFRQLWPDPPPRPTRPGLLARLFRPADRYDEELRDWVRERERWTSVGTERLRPLVAGVADGYAISLRRVERALGDLRIEPIECEGKSFDPESMEVVEVVIDSQCRPTGTVVEEVRRGYRWDGQPFRPAQVKVAR